MMGGGAARWAGGPPRVTLRWYALNAPRPIVS